MLRTLTIRDIVLIEQLSLQFSAGFTILTGETGAGKSILIDALTLALGGRGDAGLVRHGAAQGHVTAVFEVGKEHAACQLLAENGLPFQEELILRRVQLADGRTRAFVNDEAVSAGLLKALGECLVEIHGQHDARALVDAAHHRDLLDAFGGLMAESAAVRQVYRALRAAEAERDALKRRIEAARREADYLEASVAELTHLAPREGEEAELAETRQTMMRAEKTAGDLREASEALSGSASPIAIIAGLVRRLERKAEVMARAQASVEALARALDQLEEAREQFEALLRESDYDPATLERVEERLFALRGAARKFSVLPDELPLIAAKMASELAEMESGNEALREAEKAVHAAHTAYERAARRLAAARGEAARRLEEAVMAELPALKLERARFLVALVSDPALLSETGYDTVEFWVETNPGSRPGPLMKVASGGELSRFLLAIKVALADKGSAPTLIFDEIDTGAGGAVAEAIGVRLQQLAARVQVLAVTHAPQVAARAAAHFLIAKTTAAEAEERIVTRVAALDPAARREEIARMLAGAEITEEARRAADRLIEGR